MRGNRKRIGKRKSSQIRAGVLFSSSLKLNMDKEALSQAYTLRKIFNICIWIELTQSKFQQGSSWCRWRRYSSPEMTYRTMYCVTFKIKFRGIMVLWFLVNYFIMHVSLSFLLPKVICILHACLKQETQYLFLMKDRKPWYRKSKYEDNDKCGRTIHINNEFN